MQLGHHNYTPSPKSFPITVILDHLRTPENVGMAFRMCEAFGVQKLIIPQDSPHAKDNVKVRRAARNADQTVPFEIVSSLHTFIQDLRSNQTTIIALELTAISQDIRSLNLTTQMPIAIIVGNERVGIEEEILKLCDTHLHINMYGNNTSINVITALAIGLHECTGKMEPLV